jgi:hypothetical protein
VTKQSSGASRRENADAHLFGANLLFEIRIRIRSVIASSVPALGPTLMDETNTAVIARLDRATQYSRDV